MHLHPDENGGGVCGADQRDGLLHTFLQCFGIRHALAIEHHGSGCPAGGVHHVHRNLDVHRQLLEQAVGDHPVDVVRCGQPADSLVDLTSVPFAELSRYDAAHFPAPREPFLKAWITQPGSRALGAVQDGALRGYGVIRPCRQGFKVGPLFAADGDTAEALYRGLGDIAPGEPIYLDVPEDNPQAMALAERHGMREVFGCARMYYGPPPVLPQGEIFGVTTFELG